MLNRDFTADALNNIWISDVTQFNVKRCKFYIDDHRCFSRKVVSYHISGKDSTQLANTTFKEAY